MLWKCCTQYVIKFWELSSGYRTGKGQFSFQSQRKAMPKNAQSTAQLYSSHTSKVILKILQARLQQYMNRELPDVQAGFRTGRGTRDQIAHIHWSSKKQESCRINLLLLYWLCQRFWLCGSQQTVENSSRDGNTRPPDLPPEKSIAGQEATIRTRHGKTDWFQIGKGVCQGCILSPCLFNLSRVHHVKCWPQWSTSWNQDCWKKYQ